MRLLTSTTLFASTAMRLWVDACGRPQTIKPEGENAYSLGHERPPGA